MLKWIAWWNERRGFRTKISPPNLANIGHAVILAAMKRFWRLRSLLWLLLPPYLIYVIFDIWAEVSHPASTWSVLKLLTIYTGWTKSLLDGNFLRTCTRISWDQSCWVKVWINSRIIQYWLWLCNTRHFVYSNLSIYYIYTYYIWYHDYIYDIIRNFRWDMVRHFLTPAFSLRSIQILDAKSTKAWALHLRPVSK